MGTLRKTLTTGLTAAFVATGAGLTAAKAGGMPEETLPLSEHCPPCADRREHNSAPRERGEVLRVRDTCPVEGAYIVRRYKDGKKYLHLRSEKERRFWLPAKDKDGNRVYVTFGTSNMSPNRDRYRRDARRTNADAKQCAGFELEPAVLNNLPPPVTRRNAAFWDGKKYARCNVGVTFLETPYRHSESYTQKPTRVCKRGACKEGRWVQVRRRVCNGWQAGPFCIKVKGVRIGVGRGSGRGHRSGSYRQPYGSWGYGRQPYRGGYGPR